MLFTVLLVVILIAAVAYLAQPYLQARKGGVTRYHAVTVLKASEQTLHARLVEALPGLLVLCKVQLSAFLSAAGNKKLQAVGGIDEKTADYLICRPDYSVIAVVEISSAKLQLRSVKAAAAKKNGGQTQLDQIKHRALASAGIPVISVSPRQLPDIESIQQTIQRIDLDILFAKEASAS